MYLITLMEIKWLESEKLMGPPEQRSYETKKKDVSSTHSVDPRPSTQHTIVPLYMAAGAEAAAVRATSQQVKRWVEEEDSEETSVQIKQIKPDNG